MAPVNHSSVVPPPVSGDRPLKRVVSMTGAYGLRNYTIKDLRDLKGVRQLVETNPESPEDATAAEEAGIDTIKMRFDPKAPQSTIERRQAAPHTFMTYALALTTYASKTEALRAAFDAMEAGLTRSCANGVSSSSRRWLRRAFPFRVILGWFPGRAPGQAACARWARQSKRRCKSIRT